MKPGNMEEKIGSEEKVTEYLAEYTLEGKWEKVKEMYYTRPEAHSAIINEGVGTALHVAVDLDEEGVVQELVNAIITVQLQQHSVRIKALEVGNDRGDTPLHVAASRGFAKICNWIIGMNNERVYLASRKNKHGETPLFLAAINWKKQAFAYLSHVSTHTAPLQDLVRDNGDTILHCAIRREYFDLAVIIVHYYDFLSTHKNKEGFTPLKVLATRPSAFKSASKLSWWKRILYHCILVEPLDAEKQMKANLAKMEKQPKSDKVNYPKNYATLCDFFTGSSSVAALFGKLPVEKNQVDTENPPMNKQSRFAFGTRQVGFLPPNYETFQQFVRTAYVHTLGLSGVELKEVKKTKKRHQWSGQLLRALMKRPYAAFTGSETSELGWLEEEREPEADDNTRTFTRSDTIKNETDQNGKETPFLVAARNGIVEMVNEILHRIPSVIHNTNSKKENVLLVAVVSRQPLVVECLRMKMQSKPEVWNNLILAVDEDENTMLHLAAYAPGGDKPWQIAGSALQMMWDIKWFQYIKSLVPQHFLFRSDKEAKTAGEIFEETHKELIKESGDWLKDTSESCSVVAALVAGVSFATASSVPGGTNEEGRPNLEGKPAFDVFAIASLVGLCFSVTGLIMFLTILTSRKQAKDFRRDLPLKLLLGLSSLFVSIGAMFVSFCTGHFFLLSHRYKMVLYPIYAATCFPVTFYAVAQFPLYFDLLTAIITKVPRASDKGDRL
uniref:Ankyrin repeat-containing protein At3g12360 family n=1 Tax=Cajanus cajan TaxID=3821 RepID=A0A151U1R1_CAJCA|nr:Ankyrin repeat-containing protein At3g12360 family [Cajanus cajan]